MQRTFTCGSPLAEGALAIHAFREISDFVYPHLRLRAISINDNQLNSPIIMLHTDAAFDDNVRRLIDDYQVPGLGIAVVQGDQIHAKVLTVAYETIAIC